MADEKQDPDNFHILEPEKDEHTEASGSPSARLIGVVCTTCGGRNGKHRKPCGSLN